MTGPIGPGDVTGRRIAQLPPEVFEVFNELIARHWDGASAVVRQRDAVLMLVAKGFTEQRILDDHLLDVEDAYRAQGWKVYYDKPAYNESYEPTFTFSKKGKRGQVVF